MIDLYTWTTPNGRKVSIMLEEVGLPYRAIPVDINASEQFKPEFLRISPNNKIPAIVDRDTGISLMESGAILLYLADKAGALRGSGKGGWQAVEWLMMQMGSVGPMLGQAHHFLKFNRGKSEYAEKRYGDEAQRIYGVLNTRLADAEYLAGDYSIADIATWPWIARYEWQGIDWAPYPALKRWYLAIAARPAVQRLSRAEGSHTDLATRVKKVPMFRFRLNLKEVPVSRFRLNRTETTAQKGSQTLPATEASARTCAGVVPQQPPMICAPPASQPRARSASSSGLTACVGSLPSPISG
jgi:GST-like protein